MRENCPFPATIAEALPNLPPTVSTASQGRGDGHSAAKVPQVAGKEPCDLCGSTCWDTAHFAMGKLWCPECWAGREAAAAMPPTPAERRQLDLWMQPHRGAL